MDPKIGQHRANLGPDAPSIPEGLNLEKSTKKALSVAKEPLGIDKEKEVTAKVETPRKPIPAASEEERHAVEPVHVEKESLLEKGKKYMTGLKAILGLQSKEEVSVTQLTPVAAVKHNDDQHQVAIEKTISYLNDRGYKDEGLLRKAGDGKTVKELEGKIYESNSEIPKDVEIYAATDALKVAWRAVSFDKAAVGSVLEEVNASGKPDLEELKMKIAQDTGRKVLTDTQRVILDEVLEYAVNVAKESGTNLMPASNIATILAPALGDFGKWGAVTDVLTAIIENNADPTRTPFKFSV